MGYDVEIVPADLGPVFTALNDGELDAYVATWLPVTHGPYLDAIKDNVEDLGINYKGIRIGLVVPDYVDINSIEELNANKEKFNGEIIGLDPAAGITEAVFKVMDDYDLDFTQIESNEAALIAALSAAIDNEEWIVVAGWVPHWKFNEWDLKFLDDPKESFGEEENIHVLAANGFSEEMPEAAQFLANFFLTAEEMSSLMAMVDQADANNASGAVREWIEENEATVQSWLP